MMEKAQAKNRPLVVFVLLIGVIMMLLAGMFGLQNVQARSEKTAVALVYPHWAAYNASPYNPSTRQWLPFVNGDPAWPWLSRVYVSCAAPFTASLDLKYIDGDGVVQNQEAAEIPPWGNRVFTTPSTFSGTLLLEADYPIYAVAHYLNDDPGLEGDGLMMVESIDHARGESDLVMGPVYHHFVGLDSFIAIQNMDNVAAAADLAFYDLSGNLVVSVTHDLSPLGGLHLPLAAVPGLPDPYAGVVHISGQGDLSGLVFTSRETTPAAIASQARPFTLGTPGTLNAVLVPMLTKETGLLVSNDGNVTASMVLEAFDQAGSFQMAVAYQIPPGGTISLYMPTEPQLPDGFLGSAGVYSDQPIAVKVQTQWWDGESGYDNIADYTGIVSDSLRLGDRRFPFVTGDTIDTRTLIAAQNYATQTATIQIQYFDQEGVFVASDSASVKQLASAFFDQAGAGLPDGFRGSALVSSDQGPVAAVALVSETGPLPAANLEGSYKSVQPSAFIAGDTLTFTVTIVNQSPVSDTVTLTDPIPADCTYVTNSASASDGGEVLFDGTTLTWQGMVSGASPVTVQYAVRTQIDLPITATIVNTATLAAATGSRVQVQAEALHNPGYLLTINQGDLFTNSPVVDLRYAWDTNDAVTQVQFSNDGGFAPGGDTSAWLAVDAVDPTYQHWPITTHGDNVLPRTVYARFKDGGGQLHGPIQDDIIYDPVAPTLWDYKIVVPDGPGPAAAGLMTQDTITVTVIVTSTDDNSGVEFIELSASGDFSGGQEFPAGELRTEIQWPMEPAGLVYIRAIDQAGNASAAAAAPGPGREFVYLPMMIKKE